MEVIILHELRGYTSSKLEVNKTQQIVPLAHRLQRIALFDSIKSRPQGEEIQPITHSEMPLAHYSGQGAWTYLE